MFKSLKKLFGIGKREEKEKTQPSSNENTHKENDKTESIQKTENTIKDDNKEKKLFPNPTQIDPDYNPNEVCHRILYKGSNINIEHYKCFPCIKIKEKGGFLTSIGIKESEEVQIHYLIFLDEVYFYLMKDIIYDKSKPHLRCLGNKYNLFAFENISFNQIEGGVFRLIIEINSPNSQEETIDKVLYFSEVAGLEFYNYFSNFLAKLGIVNLEEENGDATQKEEDEKEEKDEDEKNDEGLKEEGEQINEEQLNEEEVKEEVKEDEGNEEEPVSSERKKKKKKKIKKSKEKISEEEEISTSMEGVKEEISTEKKEGEDIEQDMPKEPEVKHKKKKKVKKKKGKETQDEEINELEVQKEKEQIEGQEEGENN